MSAVLNGYLTPAGISIGLCAISYAKSKGYFIWSNICFLFWFSNKLWSNKKDELVYQIFNMREESEILHYSLILQINSMNNTRNCSKESMKFLMNEFYLHNCRQLQHFLFTFLSYFAKLSIDMRVLKTFLYNHLFKSWSSITQLFSSVEYMFFACDSVPHHQSLSLYRERLCMSKLGSTFQHTLGKCVFLEFRRKKYKQKFPDRKVRLRKRFSLIMISWIYLLMSSWMD